MSGLSDRDRRLLEEGRRNAAEVMGRERVRLAERAQRDAEKAERDAIRRAQAEQDGAEHRAKYGPLKVTGRDRVPVQLDVQPSGLFGIGGDGGGDLFALVVAVLLLGLANLFSHYVLFLGGSTLHITARGRKKIKIRLRSKEAAAQRLQEVAAAVRRHGVAALSSVRKPRRA